VAGEGNWKVVLERVAREKIADIRDEIMDAFHLGQSQANDMVNNVPLILFEGYASEDEGNIIKGRLSNIIARGGDIRVTEEILEHTLKLYWPGGPPKIAQVNLTSAQVAEAAETEQGSLTIAKYNFTVSEERVFRCPTCGAMFLMKQMTPEEREEAVGQLEIQKLLENRKPAATAAAAAQTAAPKDDLELLRSMEEIDELDDGISPRKRDEDLMDFAAFEKGLSKLGPDKQKGGGTRRRPAPRPKEDKIIDLGPMESAEEQKIFNELEELPDKLDELEPVPPDEAVKQLEKESKKPTVPTPPPVPAPAAPAPPAPPPPPPPSSKKETVKDVKSVMEITEFYDPTAKKEDQKRPAAHLETIKTEPAPLRPASGPQKIQTAPAPAPQKPQPPQQGARPSQKIQAVQAQQTPSQKIQTPPVQQKMEPPRPPQVPPKKEPVEMIIEDAEDELMELAEEKAPAPPPPKPAVAPRPAPVPKPAPPAPPKPAPAQQQESGDYGLVLSKITVRDKKTKAADIIAEIQGISADEAMELTDKIVVKIASGVSKETAEALSQRFRDIGVASRVTTPKGASRISDRLNK
jgi:ribosomal protein L7/L12